MNSDDVIQDVHAEGVRALRAEAGRLKAELASALNRIRAWENHFDAAVLAARDADRLPSGGVLVIVDGWNFQLGCRGRGAPGKGRRETATEAAENWLRGHPDDFAWVVFDGSRENAREQDRLRVTFTGGEGAHRADKAVCDFIHMMRMTGRAAKVTVVTDDRDFRGRVEALGASVIRAADFSEGKGT